MQVMQRSSGIHARSASCILPLNSSRSLPKPQPLAARSVSVRRGPRQQVVRAGFYGSKDNKPPTRPGGGPSWLDEAKDRASPPAVSDIAAAGETDVSQSTARSLRTVASISFWAQLSLSVVSGVILFFAIQSGTAPGQAPNVSVYFTLVGVIFSFFSTFRAQMLRRRAWGVLTKGDTVATGKVVSGLLANITINLWGLGATVIGLQATVGTLVAKTLSTSSTNPYVANPGAARSAPAALDAFSIQASTNTVLAHFCAIVCTNWALGLLNRAAAKAQPA